MILISAERTTKKRKAQRPNPKFQPKCGHNPKLKSYDFVRDEYINLIL